MEPNPAYLFRVMRELCHYKPPFVLICDELFYFSFLQNRFLQNQFIERFQNLEDYVGCEIKLFMTNCSIQTMIGEPLPDGVDLPCEMIQMIECKCANIKAGSDCIKELFNSKELARDMSICIATEDVSRYYELQDICPVIFHNPFSDDPVLELMVPHEVHRLANATQWKEMENERRQMDSPTFRRTFKETYGYIAPFTLICDELFCLEYLNQENDAKTKIEDYLGGANAKRHKMEPTALWT